MTNTVRSFAFYLPQYHPIAENDEWWGKGFTEWTNVTKSKPLFNGHVQPRLPSDLGFYDLRLPEARQAQADLAREYGIEGFIYYHYWFGGKRLLERPFEEVLNSGEPDLPFALCWANEDWRRNWDGHTGELLLRQDHSYEDDLAHIKYLLKAFTDPRYIRVDGKPLFLIYRASMLEDLSRTIQTWRQEARRAGIGELYLCRVESANDEVRDDPRDAGFDASVEFGVDWRNLGSMAPNREIRVADYADMAHRMLKKPEAPYRRHAGVATGFDNSPRNKKGFVLEGATPSVYREWVGASVERELERHPDEDVLLFVTAWNEWAEGALLEPCSQWGRGFIEAHAAGVEDGLTGNVKLDALADEQFPDFTIAIVTGGGAANLMQCLNATVQASTDAGAFEFLVIDNASTDETAALLHELRGDIRSFRLPTAVSWPEAWTIGLNAARSDRVLLLSVDMLLEPGWFPAVSQKLESTPDASAVSLGVEFEDKVIRSQMFSSQIQQALYLSVWRSRMHGLRDVAFVPTARAKSSLEIAAQATA